MRKVVLALLLCLNPPKGPPTISTPWWQLQPTAPTQNVSIPRRVRRRFPRRRVTFTIGRNKTCLNPPKGPPTISTADHQRRILPHLCLNPPKGPPTISTKSSRSESTSLLPFNVSIPRRVRRRFPRLVWDFFILCLLIVSIPRRVRRRFPLDSHGVLAWPLSIVSIPRRVRRRFPHGCEYCTRWANHRLSQSPEGSADDFHTNIVWTMVGIMLGSVSIPRRVRRRFPPWQRPGDSALGNLVSIPRRVRRRFPRGARISAAELEILVVSIPRRVRRRFPRWMPSSGWLLTP